MAFKALFNEVEFLAQFPMVGLAISDSTGPVPGYLFGEINAITYVENGCYCKPLANFLVSRLKCDTPLACIKVLKLLMYLVQNGHTQMIDGVRFHEVPLKEARSFNGPPDAVHGNSFYQTIRKMAQELLDYIFSENKGTSEEVPHSEQITLTGYGSEASSKKMTGFGHSIKAEKSVSDMVSDSFSSFVEKLFPSPEKEALPPLMSHLGDSLPKYKPIIVEKSMSAGESTSTAESCQRLSHHITRPQRKVKVHRPGRAGGGWESSSDEESDINVLKSDSSHLEMQSSKGSTVSVESLENSKSFVQCISEISISDECKIVEEFTVKQPLCELNYSDILAICNRCSALNCDEILSLALKKVSETEELVQLRALLLIEYLLFHDIITLESMINIVSPHVQTFLEEVKNIKPSVKAKLLKIQAIIEVLSKKFQQNVSSIEQTR